MPTTRRRLITSAAAMPLIGIAGTARAAKEPVRIGVPTPLTGTYGDVGNQARRAVEFAVAEANAVGGVDGREVQARFLDTEAKTELARQQAEKLSLGGFNLLAATQTSAESLANNCRNANSCAPTPSGSVASTTIWYSPRGA